MRPPVFVALALTCALAASSSTISSAQTRPSAHHSLIAAKAVSTTSWTIAGKWLYRSYLNRPDVIVNDDAQSAAKALSLLFGEGIMTLGTPSATTISGTFDIGGGQIPAIVGSVFRAKPHGTSKAGVVASFVAVKQP